MPAVPVAITDTPRPLFQPPVLPDGREAAWWPLPGSQECFLVSPVFETLYEGTRGPGKTDTLLMDFFGTVDAGWGPEWRGILFRQTYKQLADVVAKTQKWFRVTCPAAKFNKADFTWVFPGGEELLLRHMLDPEDYWNYHGHAYPWIGWEEVTNWFTPDCYKRMMSCCRSTVPRHARDKYKRPMMRKYRATTNPYGPGHNWVKTRWRLPEMRGEIIRDVDENGNPEEPRIAIHGHLHENVILMEAEPDYERRLRTAARNKSELRAWLHGDWDITAGGMFDDIYDGRTHMVEPFEIPKSWRIDRSFDWGSAKPFSVGWWAESDGTDVTLADGRRRSTVRGDLFRIGEWYGSTGNINEGLRFTAAKVAEGIVTREIKMGLRNKEGQSLRIKPGPADSSIFDDSDDSAGKSVADQMASPVRLSSGVTSPGVRWLKADKSPGSRKRGWEHMRQLLEDAKRPEGGGPRESPGMFVFNVCRDWVRLVPVLPRDPKDLDDVDTDAEDHNGDETRYRALMGRRGARQRRAIGLA